MGSATTDAGLDILAEAGLLDRTMDSLLSALQAHLERRAGASCRCGGVLFTNTRGLLGDDRDCKGDLEHMERERGTFYAVGVGPGDPELMTRKAVRVLEDCPVLARPPHAGGGLPGPGDRPGGCGSD